MLNNKKMFFIVMSILILGITILIPNRVNASNDIIVMLDPGHGGNETGAAGGGLIEKDLTWKLATRVKEILDRTDGITGILTKENHETLGRQIRADRAKDNNADLLVSFHINSNDSSTSLSGAEVYITHNTTQKRYYEYSNILGLDILRNLNNVGVRSFAFRPKVRVGTPNDVYADGTVADYYGIISCPMHYGIPGVLIEHAFINNPYDRENYLNDAMLTKMAQADANAIIANKELFRRSYEGKINTELINIDAFSSNNGKNYLGGYIYIAEWVGNDCRTPSGTPKLTLKSTDGKVSKEMYVGYEGGIKYYFDRVLDGLDMNKEYYIEAELIGQQNVASKDKKIQRIYIPNQVIKENYQNRTLKVINNKIVFSEGEYEGDIATELREIKLVQNGKGETYIAGFVNIEEVRAGIPNTPRSMPEIWLKSTDGEFATIMYVGYEEKCEYYFDKMIEYLDSSKDYYIEAKLTTEENISKNKQQKIMIPDKTIGIFNGITVSSKDSNIGFSFEGNVNTELINVNMIQNSKGQNYISGYIYIAEWINSVCRTPSTMPRIKLKSTDNSFETDMYIGYEGGIKYYFDKKIEDLDTSKQYYIEVELTNPKNISTRKIQQVQLPNKTLQNPNKVEIKMENNYITIKDLSLYYGNVNTELIDINIVQNSKGQNYISGFIYIAEWVGNDCRTPSTMPRIKLKSADNSFETDMYVGYEGSIKYYFDKKIEGLDISKQYYIEVELTNSKNLSTRKTQQVRLTNRTIQKPNEIEVKIKDDYITMKDLSLYYGNVNTELIDINIIQNSKGQNYISGFIYIAEWVENDCRTPSTMPRIKLKSTDNSFETDMYVGYEGSIKYYFDKRIEELDTTKQYYIEVELTGSKNLSQNKVQRVRIKDQDIGICTNGNKVKIESNYVIIEEKKKADTVSLKEELKEEKIKKEEIEKIKELESVVEEREKQEPIEERMSIEE